MTSEHAAPWDHENTPLARAFARAFERQQAIAGDQAEHLVTSGGDVKAMLLSGLDVDPAELELYVEATVAGYVQLAMEGDDAHAVATMRGLAIFMLLVGELHAGDRITAERLAHAAEEAGRQLREYDRPDVVAAPEPITVDDARRVYGRGERQLARILRALFDADDMPAAVRTIRQQLGAGDAQVLKQVLITPDEQWRDGP